MQPSSIDHAAARLDAWLETTRGPGGLQGYGGPVAHWWQQSLLYTGPGCDWRYEGILFGYLALWERTGEQCWLGKARRAGEDLLRAQLPDGHYPFSAFEINPASGGTPHEAAADLGLLALAKTLRGQGEEGWEAFADAAKRNLRAYYVEKLWDGEAHSFRDHPEVPSFVPNKAATAVEAFILWSELSGEEHWMTHYGLPNLERILAHQVRKPGRLYGAIAQNSFGRRIVEKYMPFYIARCIPALVRGWELSQEARYLEGALDAMGFIVRQIQADGSLPAALYPRRQVNRFPTWVAALGDVLRAGDLLRPYGFTGDLSLLENRLLGGQDASGGIQTAAGFSAQTGGRPGDLPDARDLLHVSGWCDKAFRYLAGKTGQGRLPQVENRRFEADCVFLGRRLKLVEDEDKMELTENRQVVYQWIKGEPWARQAEHAFWLH